MNLFSGALVSAHEPIYFAAFLALFWMDLISGAFVGHLVRSDIHLSDFLMPRCQRIKQAIALSRASVTGRRERGGKRRVPCLSHTFHPV